MRAAVVHDMPIVAVMIAAERQRLSVPNVSDFMNGVSVYLCASRRTTKSGYKTVYGAEFYCLCHSQCVAIQC